MNVINTVGEEMGLLSLLIKALTLRLFKIRL